MIATILQPDFAIDIISRYTSGAANQFSGADLFLAHALEGDGGASSIGRSIQHVNLINQAITENTVLNLNIHLDFLYSIFSKTVRELHESTARHIGMLEKKVLMAEKTSPGTVSPQPASAFLAHPILSDKIIGSLAPEDRSNRADITTPAHANTISLTHTSTLGQTAAFEKNVKDASSLLPQHESERHGTEHLREIPPVSKKTNFEMVTHSAGSNAFTQKKDLPKAFSEYSLVRYVLPVFPRNNKNISPWFRELWLMEPNKNASAGGYTFLPLRQLWRLDTAEVKERNVLYGINTATPPQTLTRMPWRINENSMPYAMVSPRISRPQSITMTDKTNNSQTGSAHDVKERNMLSGKNTAALFQTLMLTPGQDNNSPFAMVSPRIPKWQSVLSGIKTATPSQALTPNLRQVDENSAPLAMVSPRIPRWQAITMTDKPDNSRTGLANTVIRTHPVAVQLQSQILQDKQDAPSGRIYEVQKTVNPGEDQITQTRKRREHIGDIQQETDSVRIRQPVHSNFHITSDTASNAISEAPGNDRVTPVQMDKLRLQDSTSAISHLNTAPTSRAPHVGTSSPEKQKESMSSRSHSAMRMSQTTSDLTETNINAEAELKRKVLSYTIVPRKGSNATVKEGNLFAGIARPLIHSNKTLKKSPHSKGDFPLSTSASIGQSSTNLHDFPKSPRLKLLSDDGSVSMNSYPAAQLPFSYSSANSQIPIHTSTMPGQSAISDSITQASVYREVETGIGRPSAASRKSNVFRQSPVASVPGAVIAYRKEAPAWQGQPPIPPKVSQDIEFIKKTVKQTGTSTPTQKTNMAVNLTGSAASAFPRQEADAIRDLDRQVNAIADKVYNALERRLRSEQMRKGLL